MPDDKPQRVMGRPVSDPLYRAIEDLGMDNNRLHARVKDLEEERGLSTPALRARADDAPTTPEIQRLEGALAQKRQLAELAAKAPPGGLFQHTERDITGRLISTFHTNDEGAAWRPFMFPYRFLGSFNTECLEKARRVAQAASEAAAKVRY